MIKKYFSKKHLSRGLKAVIIYIVVMLVDRYLLKRYSFDLATIILGGCFVFVLFWGLPFVKFKPKQEN